VVSPIKMIKLGLSHPFIFIPPPLYTTTTGSKLTKNT